MIKINKRPLPDGVMIAKDADYRGGTVFRMVTEDCHNKCYICEDSVHTAPNVEHRISHRGDSALKYDWNNLFLSCSHCNNTKSDKYDGIIDPTEVDPEQFIELSIDVDDELREMVIVRKTDGGADVDITVNLLNAVYNGGRTDIKQYACLQLKNKLSNELSWFRQKIEDYRDTATDERRAAIDYRLSDESVFAAFKRKIVRDDPELSRKFAW
jgi:hypothetical protein